MLKEGAGDLANGFISVGGASTPEIASDEMKAFVAAYTKKFGEYNDESNTKVYALEYIVETMKADPAAIDDIDEFKKTMDTFSAPEPLPQGPRRQADLCRHDLVRPEAPGRRCRWWSTSTRTAPSRRCSSARLTETLFSS